MQIHVMKKLKLWHYRQTSSVQNISFGFNCFEKGLLSHLLDGSFVILTNFQQLPNRITRLLLLIFNS